MSGLPMLRLLAPLCPAGIALCIGLLLSSSALGDEVAPRHKVRAQLGRLLFHDTKLSGDMTLRCADCHDPRRAYGDGEALSRGYDGSPYFRNASSLIGTTRAPSWFWDGRGRQAGATRLREHLLGAHFLNVDGRLLEERLRQVPHYRKAFRQSFDGPPSVASVLQALWAFMATLDWQPSAAVGSPPALRRGRQVFEGEGGCATCHSGARMSDGRAHRLAVPEHPRVLQNPERHLTLRAFLRARGMQGAAQARTDPGVKAVTGKPRHGGAFITPSLRGVAHTAPYMHNGSLPSLEAAVDFHLQGGGQGSELTPMRLSAAQRRDLLVYLRSLGSPPVAGQPPAVPQLQVWAPQVTK